MSEEKSQPSEAVVPPQTTSSDPGQAFMTRPGGNSLTIAQLAERSGVTAGTLRMWEARHGFPTPARLAGGHRRYREHDVEQVRRVLAFRNGGLSLPAAVAEAEREGRNQPSASIFGGLRSKMMGLQTVTLSKQAILALTRAVQDEYLACGEPGVVIGSFQKVRYYRQSARYWEELSRTSQITIALADFEAMTEPHNRLLEIPVPKDHPSAREWLLIVDSPIIQAFVAAWERPTPAATPDHHRRFEVIWSVAADQVRMATQVAADVVGDLAPNVADRFPDHVHGPVPPLSTDLAARDSTTHRMVSYLATTLDGFNRTRR